MVAITLLAFVHIASKDAGNNYRRSEILPLERDIHMSIVPKGKGPPIGAGDDRGMECAS